MPPPARPRPARPSSSSTDSPHRTSKKDTAAALDALALDIDRSRLHKDSCARALNALSAVEEAKQVAASSLVTLASQSERINNIEATLTRIDGQVEAANVKAKEIKRLQSLIVLPKSWNLVARFRARRDRNADAAAPVPTPSPPTPTPLASLSAKLLARPQHPSLQTLTDDAPPVDVDTLDDATALDLAQTDPADPTAAAEATLQTTLTALSTGLRLLRDASVAMGAELEAQTRQVEGLGDVGARAGEAVARATGTLEEVARGKARRKKGVVEKVVEEGPAGGVGGVVGRAVVKRGLGL
ncbi:hypothetical protein HDU96_003709 [Phlyctochytrium bullatum]|nr:hypothetical protein HDU96_003709 [Phlyctochytrium bullatum]